LASLTYLPHPSTFSDTFENFQTILAEHSTNFYYNGKDYNYSSGIDGQDDFFLSENDLLAKQNNIETSYETIIPSDRYVCTRSWVSIRSEACMTSSSMFLTNAPVGYKFLWLFGDENLWMTASASIDTPLHLKTFEIIPVDDKCVTGGWVMIRAFDPFHEDLIPTNLSMGNYVCMNTPGNISNPNESPIDEWVVKVRSTPPLSA
jgi:hypothetical protein